MQNQTEFKSTIDKFTAELTELSLRYGLGLEGAIVYVMEQEDKIFAYQIDDESHLVRA